MENISTVIKALFEKVDGDEVLKKAGYGAEKDDDPCRMDSDMIESVIVNYRRENAVICAIKQIISNKIWIILQHCVYLPTENMEPVH